MEILNVKNCEDVVVAKAPYKGADREVTGTSVRWLSRVGEDGSGNPEHGLRYFTIQPGGEIPVHNHFYHQTMYILSGQFECYQYDPETEKAVVTQTTGPGDYVYVPSMEPHGMKNIGDEAGAFLCCIANVYE
jgi:quercetin dioxygenase-like cupin family protein